ncbi:Amidase enhancer precursor [Pelotomaculum sp. FP]|uniref:SpoIID/LytB domain-containing protein n=1 Tax=Pelotomaculum sp. FP TaxID=261474 RepID=UPI0010653CA3|nr:SpoIID/LytB domain-containing protein [Pelotomaculum sp. FP]TEB13073.1 Amidase enhancer precursor [Pelotomaculum sp. FP]
MSSKNLCYLLLSIVASFLMMVPSAVAAQTTTQGLVRVELANQVDSLGFTVTGNYQLVDQSTGKLIMKLEPGEKWLVTLQNGRIALAGQRGKNGIYKGPVSVQAQTFQASILSGNGDLVDNNYAGELSVINSDGRVLPLEQAQAGITFKGSKGIVNLSEDGSLNLLTLTSNAGTTRYRGDLEFRVDGGKLTAINELNIEDYLCGVVPSEAIPSWPAEALKAQAVAARNYAMQKVETSRGDRANLGSNQYDQVYGGYDAETEATNKAVKDTSGIVMMSQGSLVTAFFHCSSGGFTENSEDVWLNPLPYIKSKTDPYDKNDKYYNWQVTYSNEQLAALMTQAGYPIKEVTDIEIEERTSSDARVKDLTVTGVGVTGKSEKIELCNADKVRIALGLKSSLFVLDKNYNKDKSLASVKITGRGYGHGLGMSQYGAYGMASQGYNYQDILKYYYSGVTLTSQYGRSSSLR